MCVGGGGVPHFFCCFMDVLLKLRNPKANILQLSVLWSCKYELLFNAAKNQFCDTLFSRLFIHAKLLRDLDVTLLDVNKCRLHPSESFKNQSAERADVVFVKIKN